MRLTSWSRVQVKKFSVKLDPVLADDQPGHTVGCTGRPVSSTCSEFSSQTLRTNQYRVSYQTRSTSSYFFQAIIDHYVRSGSALAIHNSIPWKRYSFLNFITTCTVVSALMSIEFIHHA